MKKDFLIEDIDYIEFYCGNAKQSAFYYSHLFGFHLVGYRGLETGDREKASYILELENIRIVLSTAYSYNHEISEFVKKHGDSVKDVAFRVKNVEESYHHAVQNGGIPLAEPYEIENEQGIVKIAKIGTFNDTIHTLIERDSDQFFLPGFKKLDNKLEHVHPTFLTRIDHLAINVEDMNQWTDYYEKVFDFQFLNEFKKDEVSSETSSLMTKALQNGTERIKFPIVEPAPGKKKSQVQEFLDYNQGAGIQHVALLTDDILKAVENLQKNGFQFLYTPDAYYEVLPQRVGEIDEPIEKLRQMGILVDRDDEGYLLQIFGHPMHDRPTLFFEIIQRKGSRGFGNGNIRALFESVEREQAKRGNL